MTHKRSIKDKVFILRNYNKFLVKEGEKIYWDDFYIHRFSTDFKRLLKFKTKKQAQKFLEENPEVERDFDAWIIETNKADWA